MSVGELAQHFGRDMGAPTKELYSMAGLVFVTVYFGWIAPEFAEAYIFRSGVRDALNLAPGVEVSSRTVARHQKLFREGELAAPVLHDVTMGLAEKLNLDISRQRLDSTIVFSHKAKFGRTKLMAGANERFLTQVIRHVPERHAAAPAEFRKRYEPAESQLFAGVNSLQASIGGRTNRSESVEPLVIVGPQPTL
jgi:hypothetical protein